MVHKLSFIDPCKTFRSDNQTYFFFIAAASCIEGDQVKTKPVSVQMGSLQVDYGKEHDDDYVSAFCFSSNNYREYVK